MGRYGASSTRAGRGTVSHPAAGCGWIALRPPLDSPAIHSGPIWPQSLGGVWLDSLQESLAIHSLGGRPYEGLPVRDVWRGFGGDGSYALAMARAVGAREVDVADELVEIGQDDAAGAHAGAAAAGWRVSWPAG